MKKERYVFLLVILLLIFSLSLASGITIVGRFIGGKATSGLTNLSIFISPPMPPSLTLVLPLNHTYLRNISLPLNFSSDGDNFWYNLDHNSNITITGNITFNTSWGSHILFLYANNSWNESQRNVTFEVNYSRVIIYYSEYNGSTRGNSSDFYEDYTYEQLANISNMTLENNISGKMIFLDLVNLTDDEDPYDNVVNLDNNTNISWNRIEVNATALPNLNKNASIHIYNLSYTTPRILRNGAVCSSPTCVQVDYSGGTLIFNATSFAGYTIYSAEETPEEPPPPPPPSPPGGGGGGAPPVVCAENWTCGNWSKCHVASIYQNESYIKELCGKKNIAEDHCGFRTRNCVDINVCGSYNNQPATVEACDYTLPTEIPPEPITPTEPTIRWPIRCGDKICRIEEFFSCPRDCWISWVVIMLISIEIMWLYINRLRSRRRQEEESRGRREREEERREKEEEEKRKKKKKKSILPFDI